MGAFEFFPYTNFQDLNLNELYQNVDKLTNTVNAFNERLDDLEADINNIIINYVNQLIEQGAITVSFQYDASNEALNIIITDGGE